MTVLELRMFSKLLKKEKKMWIKLIKPKKVGNINRGKAWGRLARRRSGKQVIKLSEGVSTRSYSQTKGMTLQERLETTSI